MPIRDLSLVTDSLRRLLERYIEQRGSAVGLSSGAGVTVTGYPPDQFAEIDAPYALNIYLYQVQEDEYHKNLPEPPGNDPPVRFCEMGLNLFYLLSAHANRPDPSVEVAADYKNEQVLMGLAIKAFHDYPVLDASVEIPQPANSPHDSIVFPDDDDLRHGDDELRVTLHPATTDELNKVWSATSTPLRLSAVYQVSVVLLAAEEPTAQPVPVLLRSIGAESFQPVWIRETESICTVTLLGETMARSFPHSPALLAVGEIFRILGSGLSSASARLFLSYSDWKDPTVVDVTHWITYRTETRIDVLVENTAGSYIIAPGFYQVHIRSGSALSNFSPVVISPSINTQDPPSPGVVPESGSPGSLFSIFGEHFSGTGIDSIGVYLGSYLLTEVEFDPNAPTPPPPGCFQVRSDTEIRARVPADLGASTYAVRVVANGISTLPTRWFTVEATS